MRKTVNFFYVFLLTIFGIAAALIAEDITFTTYYPAPYGAYKEFSTTGDTYLATTSGNVGIGTTEPSRLAHIYEDTSIQRAQLLVENANPSGTAGAAIIELKTRSSGYYLLANDDLDEFYICDSSPLPAQERLCIDGNGNVGIGTTDPQATLDVNGTIAVGGTPGVSGTFTTMEGYTVTVTNGIVTGITGP